MSVYYPSSQETEVREFEFEVHPGYTAKLWQ